MPKQREGEAKEEEEETATMFYRLHNYTIYFPAIRFQFDGFIGIKRPYKYGKHLLRSSPHVAAIYCLRYDNHD